MALSLTLVVGCQASGAASRPSPPRETLKAPFTAPFSGTLKRVARPDGTLTWDISGGLGGGSRGSIQLELSGHAVRTGLNVDGGGHLTVQPQGSAACTGPINTVFNNLVNAECKSPGGARTPLTVSFTIEEGDQVTGEVSTPGAPRGSGASSVPPVPSGSRRSITKGSVFVIVMENQSYARALAQPYTASLAQQFAVATNYHAVGHPSLPNYLAMTSGTTYGIRNDVYRPLPAGGLGAQLAEASVSWKAYAEGLPANCLYDTQRYAVKHNPFAFYGGVCPANVVGMDQLAADLAGSTPRLSWLIPDLCNDGHSCPPATADRWLAAAVPAILASPAWTRDGVLLITWDEDDGGSPDNRVPTIVVAPNLKSHSSSLQYDHYSLLATIEDRLGVGRLGQAATAQPLSDLLP